jgi:hypothetical protein
MNGDHFPRDAGDYLATVRTHLPAEWAQALTEHLIQE